MVSFSLKEVIIKFYILAKADIQRETKHPEGMRKIQQLEEGKAPHKPEEEDRVFEKPIFTQLLTGPSELIEGQNAHFECRVLPVGDPTLRFEWYVNGKELKLGEFECSYYCEIFYLNFLSQLEYIEFLFTCRIKIP